MGRNRWTSRLTVEDCPIHLSTVPLCAVGAFRYPSGFSGTISWPLSNGASLGNAQVEFRSDWRGRHIVVSRLALAFCGKLRSGGSQNIELTTTPPHLGGQRYWFLCECSRRVGRLYLPNGETLFRCRVCCDLTYQSAQEHNGRWAKWYSSFEWLREEFELAKARRVAEKDFSF